MAKRDAGNRTIFTPAGNSFSCKSYYSRTDKAVLFQKKAGVNSRKWTAIAGRGKDSGFFYQLSLTRIPSSCRKVRLIKSAKVKFTFKFLTQLTKWQ